MSDDDFEAPPANIMALHPMLDARPDYSMYRCTGNCMHMGPCIFCVLVNSNDPRPPMEQIAPYVARN